MVKRYAPRAIIARWLYVPMVACEENPRVVPHRVLKFMDTRLSPVLLIEISKMTHNKRTR